MLSKIQKTWAWIFAAMFIVPEVLFWFTPLSILSLVNNLSKTNIKYPISILINQQFFTNHPIYLFIALVIEWFGVLGLLIISVKLNKKLLAILLGVFLIWILILFLFAYAITNMGF